MIFLASCHQTAPVILRPVGIMQRNKRRIKKTTKEDTPMSERSRGYYGLSMGLRCLLILVLVLAMVVFASNMVAYHQYTKIKHQNAMQVEEYQKIIDMAKK